MIIKQARSSGRTLETEPAVRGGLSANVRSFGL